MAHESQRKINDTLQRSGEPYECGRDVPGDGNCFYQSFLVVAEDKAVRETLSKDARDIFTVTDFRVRLAHFMGNNSMLHSLAWFQEYKRATLNDHHNKGRSWLEYLNRVATTNDYADQLQVMCTALFCSKDILQVSEDSKVESLWLTIPGQVEGWPIPSRLPAIRLAYLHRGEHYMPLKQRQSSTLRCNRPTSVQQTTRRTSSASTPDVTPHSSCTQQRPRRATATYKDVLSKSKPDIPPKPPSYANTFMDSPSKPKSDVPAKPSKTCKVCNWSGLNLILHLKKSKSNCRDFHDMVVLEQEAKEETRRRKAVAMTSYNKEHREEIRKSMNEHFKKNAPLKRASVKEHYEKNAPLKRASSKEYYKINTPLKRASCKEYYEKNAPLRRASSKEYYEKNAPQIRAQKRASSKEYYEKHTPEKKKVMRNLYHKKEADKTEKDRFKDFRDEMRDVCAYGCICCHKILTSTKGHKWKGGLEILKQELNKLDPTLYNNCILEKELLPPGLFNGTEIYLCSTCKLWLFQKKEMPSMCCKNGLYVDPIPPELEDLNDLEATLIAKSIIFLKIFKLPVSRWPSTKDKAVHVPIDNDTLRETYNQVTSFPRLPDEAGHIPVDLKRKLEYKNTHIHSYIKPANLVKAVKYLHTNNKRYSDIKIENRYSVLANELPEADDPDSDKEDDTLDCITRNQLQMGGSTTLTNAFPEATVVTNLPQQGPSADDQTCPSVSVAPGEGKVPTNLTQEKYWVEDGFPHIFPTGQYGLHHPRKRPLTAQQFFCQRFQNVMKQFVTCTALVFAALYHIEKQSLENALSISYRRGKVVQGKLTNLEDACCVFDNQPGSFRYWQKRRYEVIAKLEQLGPFHFFFTLSCADKRWDENFAAMLSQSGLKITYEPPKQGSNEGTYSYKQDNIFVGENKEPLREYLKREDLPEMVRKNVLTITMIFDKRVHAFMSKIVMAKSNPMKAEYYHYRVEFQKRGAGHIHGVLWVDIEEIEKEHKKELEGLKTALDNLEKLKRLNTKDKEVVARFVDKFVTCSLDDENLKDTVLDVQKHSHRGSIEKKTGCYKKGPVCRFSFPRFPSERTIIAQPLQQADMSNKEYEDKKKRLKKILNDVKKVLVTLSDDDKNTFSLQDILQKARVGKTEYYEALEVSQTGAYIILKRKVNEIDINNYNPEWLKAWDGNMDITPCLDFFAIITYITDYYTKSESDMMRQIIAAAKACKDRGDNMKTQMRHLVNTFLTSREMGESEAYYRIMPHLHLSESNLKCVFVATGFPENRSNLVKPLKDKLADDDIEDEELSKGNIEIEGSEKTFRRVTPIHVKYAARPKTLEHICLAQFAISYDMMTHRESSKQKFVDGSGDISTDMIVSWHPSLETGLPEHIKLENDMGCMKLRSKRAVLRIHKIKEDKNPHEYYYSQLLLFWPWREEEKDLELNNAKKCLELFTGRDEIENFKERGEQKTKIEKTQENLFPHKNAVQEGRTVVSHLDDQRPTHIGDFVDPENEAENEEAAAEGVEADEEYAARIPSENLSKGDDMAPKPTEGKYKQIHLPKDESELAKVRAAARSLDDDQRMVLDIVLKNVKQRRAAGLGQKPKPVFLKVHGGAGCGKSHLINTMATICEYFLRINNKDLSDPLKPAIMKLAPTGQASNGIDGLTLHSAFNLPFGNQFVSLADKTREVTRNALSNLTIIVIDEMSMVKADLLYQLHMRLQEIKQNKLEFGGVSIILCGDLLQLPPVMAAQIFEAPWGEKFRQFHEICPLWDQADAIELKTNHRQGKDKDYGDLLNRLRKNKHTEEDLKTLASKVSNESPSDAVYIYGRNAPANEKNEAELAKLDGNLEVMKAIHIGKTRKFIPKISKGGFVNQTPFLNELKLKIGARVMLRYNVHTADRLTNGACGIVKGFEWSRGDKPEIKKVLVQFDDQKAGLRRRNRECPEVTEISRVSFEYQLGKKHRHHAATAKVVQFPITLAWAITAHKCQGMTIKAPTKLVADLDSCWAAGMAYVMLGRVQNINQLFLRWTYDTVLKSGPKEELKRLKANENAVKKLKVDAKALQEAEKISQKALNNTKCKNDHWLSKTGLKIASLNIQGSLQSRLEDLENDKTIYGLSDIICLQEIGHSQEEPVLEGYTCCTAGKGKNRGVAIFVRQEIAKNLKKPLPVSDEFFQGLKLSLPQCDVITVYRSPNKADQEPSFIRFTKTVAQVTADPKKPTILCGDFNFDQSRKNDLTKMLSSRGFRQIVKEPTTYRGQCIDHVYHNIPYHKGNVQYKLHYPYFSDHEAVCVTINMQ